MPSENKDSEDMNDKELNKRRKKAISEQLKQSVHLANIYYNECYADYIGQSGSLQQSNRYTISDLENLSHSFYQKTKPQQQRKPKQESRLLSAEEQRELMQMVCNLMIDNISLKNQIVELHKRQDEEDEKNSDTDGSYFVESNSLIIPANEFRSQVSIVFESQLIVEGKLIGAVHCRPKLPATEENLKNKIQSQAMNEKKETNGYSIVASGSDAIPVDNSVSGNSKRSKGKRVYRGCVVVENGAVLNANLNRMKVVIVKGRVIGKIVCDRLYIGPNAQIVGNIRAGNVTVVTGATIIGKITSGRATETFAETNQGDASSVLSAASSTVGAVQSTDSHEPSNSKSEAKDDLVIQDPLNTLNELIEKKDLACKDFQQIISLYNQINQ